MRENHVSCLKTGWRFKGSAHSRARVSLLATRSIGGQRVAGAIASGAIDTSDQYFSEVGDQ